MDCPKYNYFFYFLLRIVCKYFVFAFPCRDALFVPIASGCTTNDDSTAAVAHTEGVVAFSATVTSAAADGAARGRRVLCKYFNVSAWNCQ